MQVSIFFIVTVCMSLSWIFVTRRAIDQNNKAVTTMLIRQKINEAQNRRMLRDEAENPPLPI